MSPNFSLTPQALPITFIASFLFWIMFAFLIILWMTNKGIKGEHLFHAVVASFLAWVIVEITKGLFPVLRPFQYYNVSPLTITVPNDSSFPSMHAATSFALAVSVTRKNNKLGLVFLLGAVLVSMGRLLSFVHYAIDIAAGTLIGIGAAYITEKSNISLKNYFRT